MPFDKRMPYPRLCAHRGSCTVAPENTMPAFGAAVAMGAEEIEFDLWASSDGELVTAHDNRLERVSDGSGEVCDHTLAELKAMDFGCRFGDAYKELRIPTLEEILKKLAGRVIMNIHVKIWDSRKPDLMIEKIAALIEKYDCERHVYFMSTNTEALLKMRKRLPYASYCQGAGKGNDAMIDAAIEHGFDKVQIVEWYPYDKAMIDRCHEHGIICNFCDTVDPTVARELFNMGIDCVLTDDYHRVRAGLLKG